MPNNLNDCVDICNSNHFKDRIPNNCGHTTPLCETLKKKIAESKEIIGLIYTPVQHAMPILME